MAPPDSQRKSVSEDRRVRWYKHMNITPSYRQAVTFGEFKEYLDNEGTLEPTEWLQELNKLLQAAYTKAHLTYYDKYRLIGGTLEYSEFSKVRDSFEQIFEGYQS